MGPELVQHRPQSALWLGIVLGSVVSPAQGATGLPEVVREAGAWLG